MTMDLKTDYTFKGDQHQRLNATSSSLASAWTAPCQRLSDILCLSFQKTLSNL